MALKDNLIRYYKFEETSGSSFVDTMGNSNGSYSGTYTINQTGKINKSVLINGGYGYFGQLPSSYSANTVSFWFKANSFVSGHVDMFAQFGWADYYIRTFFHDYLSPANTLFIDCSGSSGYNAGFTPTTGTWYHLVLVTTGNQCKIYINGSLVSTLSVTSYSPGVYNGSSIGQGWQSSNPDGSTSNVNIDELAIWDRAITATEVSELYNSGNGYEIPFATIYTLVAAQTSFSLTGYSILLKRIIKGLLSYGSYALTGIASLFKKITKMSVTNGSFSLTGFDLLVHRLINIVLSAGSFALTGIDVIFVKGRAIFMSAGNFAVTGSDLLVHRLIHLVASAGTYTLSGINSLFHKVTKGLLDFGSFVVTGQDSLFHRVTNLLAEFGAYVYTGDNTTFHKRVSVILDSGSYILTGFSLLFHRGYTVILSAGNFVLTGLQAFFSGLGSWLWTKQEKDDGDEWVKQDKN